jgi:hypothetical protein
MIKERVALSCLPPKRWLTQSGSVIANSAVTSPADLISTIFGRCGILE